MVQRTIYIVMAVSALSIFCMQKLDIPLPKLINNYANDLLCLPLVLGALTFMIRHFKKDNYFTFPLAFVLILATYYSVYFEYYLPKVNPRYTSDWIDVVLYFASAVVFFLIQSRKKEVSYDTAN